MFYFPESLTAAAGLKMAAWLKMNTWFKTGTGLNSTILLVLLLLPALALGQQEYCQITPEHTLCNLPASNIFYGNTVAPIKPWNRKRIY